MSRKLTRTGAFPLPPATLFSVLTVPSGHKYEIIGWAITADYPHATDAYALATLDGTLQWISEHHGPANHLVIHAQEDSVPLLGDDEFYLVANGPTAPYVSAVVWYVDVWLVS